MDINSEYKIVDSIKMDGQNLIYLMLVITLISIFAAVFVAKSNGYIDFITKSHWIGLILLILSGVLVWMAMNIISNPGEIRMNKKQLVALISSVLIAVMMWARFSYVIAE